MVRGERWGRKALGTGGFHWRVAARVSIADAPLVEAVLEPVCDAVGTYLKEENRTALVEGFVGAEPDKDHIQTGLNAVFADSDSLAPKAMFDLVPPADWIAENLMEFPPLRLGRFLIHGSHSEIPPRAGTITLQLDAGTAFGSGGHGSTAGCLAAVEALARKFRPRRVLDLGCGSGILGLAAAKLWRADVLLTDNDPEAVRVAEVNARRNGLARFARTAAADGYRSGVIRDGAPYDLIIVNILARPVRRMAIDLGRHLAPGGYGILSGFLTKNQEMVLSAQRHAGLKMASKAARGGWLTVVVRKPYPSAGSASGPARSRHVIPAFAGMTKRGNGRRRSASG